MNKDRRNELKDVVDRQDTQEIFPDFANTFYMLQEFGATADDIEEMEFTIRYIEDVLQERLKWRRVEDYRPDDGMLIEVWIADSIHQAVFRGGFISGDKFRFMPQPKLWWRPRQDCPPGETWASDKGE